MWPSPRRLVLAAFLAGLAPLLAAGPAKAADTFTPDVDVTLAPGAGHDVAKTLTLGALPNQADILFAIDTTGSMDDAIDDARNEATLLLVGAFLARSGRYRPRRLRRPAGRR